MFESASDSGAGGGRPVVSLASLEADARKMETGDSVFRGLPKVFRFLRECGGGVPSQRGHRGTSTTFLDAEAAADPVGSTQVGLGLLQEVYDATCCDYLDATGVYDLLDSLAAADLAPLTDPSQHHPAHLGDRSAVRGGCGSSEGSASEGVVSPTLSSSPNVGSFSHLPPPAHEGLGGAHDLQHPHPHGHHATPSISVHPSLPLVRAVERWRLQHPSSHHLDAALRLASMQYSELVDTLASPAFLLTIEGLVILRRPSATSQFIEAEAAARRRATALQGPSTGSTTLSTTALTTSATADFSKLPPPNGNRRPSTNDEGEEDDIDQDATGVGTKVHTSPWVCGEYSLNPRLDEDVERVRAYCRRLDRKVIEVQDLCDSVDAADRSLELYPWSSSLRADTRSLVVVSPETMREALAAVELLLAAAERAHHALRLMMEKDKSWILCLNENLAFLKRETTCEPLPRLMAALAQDAKELSRYSTSVAARQIPHVQWLLQNSVLVHDINWVVDGWTQSSGYLTFLQRLLIAQMESFTIVMAPGEDGQPVPMRQVTTTPTTRLDRLYAEKRSVVVWGGIFMRKSFASWEDLREAPLHRIAQQLKKAQLEKKSTFEVCYLLIAAQLQLPPGTLPLTRPDLFDADDELYGSTGLPRQRLQDFLDEEMTMFFYEKRNVKFASQTVTRK